MLLSYSKKCLFQEYNCTGDFIFKYDSSNTGNNRRKRNKEAINDDEG